MDEGPFVVWEIGSPSLSGASLGVHGKGVAFALHDGTIPE
jgi:hypothetical protein